MAADDPGYGAAMAAHLGTADGEAGTDSALPREYLRACSDELAARCAPTARLPRRQESMPEPGAVAAWPAAWKPQRAPGQATA